MDVAAVAGLPAPAADDWAVRTSDYRVRWFPDGELYGPPDAHGRRYSRAGWHIQRWDGGEIEPAVLAAFRVLVRAASSQPAPAAEPRTAGTEHRPVGPAASGDDMPMLIDLDGRS